MGFDGNIFLFVLLCFLVPSCYRAWVQPSSYPSMLVSFEKWMSDYGRRYETEGEKQKRFKIFRDNMEYIHKFNSDKRNTYRLGLNDFTDLTKEEFIALYAGGNKSPRPSHFANEKMEEGLQSRPPLSLDWRKKNVIVPVKNQGQCGSCWAFSAVAAIESLAAIKSGVLLSLSEQQIVDCDSMSGHCGGGHAFQAFDYVVQNHGLASESDYPYIYRNIACRDKPVPSSLKINLTSYTRIPPYNETALLMAVAQQPVSVGIDPTRMQHYAGGVITGECGDSLIHAVAVVGYGTSEDGIKFWLLKNSWGGNWGEDGYVRVGRDSGVWGGTCGIAIDMVYPVTSGA